MKSYIVRIYREREKDPRNLVGIVEEVGTEGRKAFTNLDELWAILDCKGRESGKGRSLKRKTTLNILAPKS